MKNTCRIEAVDKQKELMKLKTKEYEDGITAGIKFSLHIKNLHKANNLPKELVTLIINDILSDIKTKNECISFSKGFIKVVRNELLNKELGIVTYNAEEVQKYNDHGIIVEEISY